MLSLPGLLMSQNEVAAQLVAKPWWKWPIGARSASGWRLSGNQHWVTDAPPGERGKVPLCLDLNDAATGGALLALLQDRWKGSERQVVLTVTSTYRVELQHLGYDDYVRTWECAHKFTAPSLGHVCALALLET